MARSKTVSVTVRLPVGIVAILNDAVERGMFASTSDAIRSLVGRTLQVTSSDVVGGPMKGMEIGSIQMEESGTMKDQDAELEDESRMQETTENAQDRQEAGAVGVPS